MIVEAIVGAVAALLTWIGSIFPSIVLPSWVGSLAGHVSTISGWAAPLGNWLPFGAMGGGVTFVMVCLVIAFAVKFVRIFASFFTGGGGGAA